MARFVPGVIVKINDCSGVFILKAVDVFEKVQKIKVKRKHERRSSPCLSFHYISSDSTELLVCLYFTLMHCGKRTTSPDNDFKSLMKKL